MPSLADLQSIAIIPDGLQYREAISKDWSGAAYDDIIAATEQASTLPYVDRARVRRRLFRVPVGFGTTAETVWLLRSGRGAGRELWRIQYAPLRTVFGRLQDPDEVLTTVAWLTVMNLMNGRNTDGRFRCLVNHDGIFDCATTYYTTEEL